MRVRAAAEQSEGALATRLRARMAERGPMPFADWMEACLYDPDHGFYRHGRHPAGVGEGSHFATSPTLHPFFAQCVARELTDAWEAAGKPPTWTVAEFGAGGGELAHEAVRSLRKARVPVDWVAVDVRDVAAGAGQPVDGLRWSATAPERFDAAVANEFLDALPFDLHEWMHGAWQRVGVGVHDGRFVWQLLGESRIRLPPGRTDGERRAVMPGLPMWLAALDRAGARFAIVADYGGDRPSGDARAYRGHDHADPLDEPGSVDLTADVDFAQLAAMAASNGFRCSAETQESFLLRHGIFDAINAVDRSTAEGASSYLRLRQLLLPTGLGTAFKVARLSRDAPR